MGAISQANSFSAPVGLRQPRTDRPVFESTEIGDQFPAAEIDEGGFFDPDPLPGGDGSFDRPSSYEDVNTQTPYLDLELS